MVTGWLAGSVADLLNCWLAGLLASLLAGWLASLLAGWLAGECRNLAFFLVCAWLDISSPFTGFNLVRNGVNGD